MKGTAGSVAASLLVGYAAAQNATLCVALVTLLVAGGFAFVRPKVAAFSGLLVILCAPAVLQSTGVEILTYADEAAVLLVAASAISRRLLSSEPLRRLPGGRWLVAYALIGGLSSFVADVPLSIAVQDLLLFTKGAVFGFGVLQLNWSASDLPKLGRWALAAFGMLMVTAVVNFALPSWWTSNFALLGREDVRGAFGSLIGLATHPGWFGQLMALSALALFATMQVTGRQLRLPLLLAVIGVLLSYRRKAMLGLVAGAAMILRPVGRRVNPVLIVVFVLGVGLLATSDTVAHLSADARRQYLDQNQSSARTVMTLDSIGLAKERFPLGVGLGRFGGDIASKNYSPVYDELGYNRIYGLARNSGEDFKRDTFWPAVLAETGVFGFTAYLAGLVAAFQFFRRCRRSDVVGLRALATIGVVWSVEYAVESVAAPVYSAPPVFPLLFALLGITAALANESIGDSMPREEPPTSRVSGRR